MLSAVTETQKEGVNQPSKQRQHRDCKHIKGQFRQRKRIGIREIGCRPEIQIVLQYAVEHGWQQENHQPGRAER